MTQNVVDNISNGFKTISVQTFATAGTFTYTPTANMLYCFIQICGGGGAGGSALGGVTTIAAAGGGSPGAYAQGWLTAASIGASQSLTIGAAGAPGAAGNNPGGIGGTSTFGTSPVFFNCPGAPGGNGSGASLGATYVYNRGGLSANAPGADASVIGFVGSGGRTPLFSLLVPSLTVYLSGKGASGNFGTGGEGLTTIGAGNAGSGNGSGGGGATASTTSTQGGAGTAGIIIITEYCK